MFFLPIRFSVLLALRCKWFLQFSVVANAVAWAQLGQGSFLEGLFRIRSHVFAFCEKNNAKIDVVAKRFHCKTSGRMLLFQSFCGKFRLGDFVWHSERRVERHTSIEPNMHTCLQESRLGLREGCRSMKACTGVKKRRFQPWYRRNKPDNCHRRCVMFQPRTCHCWTSSFFPVSLFLCQHGSLFGVFG